jgi:hypothetical protein
MAMFSRLNLSNEYTLDEITAKLGNPIPIAMGDYLTIVDTEDDVYYILKVTAKAFKPIYPVYYSVKKVGRWSTAVQALIMFDKDV